MVEVPPFRLGGETDPNAWHFSRLGEDGPLPNPVGHTFPLVTHDSYGKWRLVGTGFYVNDKGFFVTARHVIEEVLQDGRQALPLVIIHFRSATGLFGPSECHFRPIARCWISETCDIAFGVAATATNNLTGETMNNWTWTLSFTVPADTSPISTYAFPNHLVTEDGHRILFAPHVYSGRVLSTGSFRDRVMVPFPYLEVDFRIHGAASGGPIIFANYIVGVNCAELSRNLDHPAGPGHGAQSCCLTSAFLDNIVLPTETEPRVVTFDELVRSGCINVENYQPPTAEVPRNGMLVDLSMPITAAPPTIVIEQYA